MLEHMNDDRKIIGWRRTDSREGPETFEITSSTDPDSIDLGDWEPVYEPNEKGHPS